MNVTNYWPMAREYSVWNATVAALQFWTADLKNSCFSVAPLNKFTTPSFIPYLHIYYANSLQHLKVYLHWKMKDTRMVVKILIYPLHSEEPPEYTMVLVIRTSPLIQQHHTAQVPASHIANPSDIDEPSAPLMMRTPLQLTIHYLPV